MCVQLPSPSLPFAQTHTHTDTLYFPSRSSRETLNVEGILFSCEKSTLWCLLTLHYHLRFHLLSYTSLSYICWHFARSSKETCHSFVSAPVQKMKLNFSWICCRIKPHWKPNNLKTTTIDWGLYSNLNNKEVLTWHYKTENKSRRFPLNSCIQIW